MSDVDCCPSLKDRIEECWHPHDFRYIIKKCKVAPKPFKYLEIVTRRLEFVLRETDCELLSEIKEEIETFLSTKKVKKKVKEVPRELDTIALRRERKVIERNEVLLIKVFYENNRNALKAAKKLGLEKRRLVTLLNRYGVAALKREKRYVYNDKKLPYRG